MLSEYIKNYNTFTCEEVSFQLGIGTVSLRVKLYQLFNFFADENDTSSTW